MATKTQSPPPGSFAKLMATQPNKDVPSQSPTSKKKATKNTIKPKEDKRVRASVRARKHVSMQAYMRAIIEDKATNSFTFRYPPEVLNKLEEIIHKVWGKHRVKLTKNSMAVIGLAYLLWDFEENGKVSILYKLLVKKTK